MSQENRDFLKEYAGLASAQGLSFSDADIYGSRLGNLPGDPDLDDDLEDAPSVGGGARPLTAYQQAQLARASARDQRAAADRAQAKQAKADARNAARRGVALAALDRAHGLAQGVGSIPTPGGLGALLVSLLALVSLTVPVTYAPDGTSAYTRANLLWLTLIGKTKLASSGAAAGETGSSGSSSSSSSSASSSGGGLGAAVGAGARAGLGGLIGGPIGAVVGGLTSNQAAVAQASASAQSSQQANALPPASGGPYRLGQSPGAGLPPLGVTINTF